MKIIRSVSQMQKICLALKKTRKIAVVPTMGALHDGHLSLVKIAQKKADVVIVTIFVNPTQFGKNEDLAKYPHDEKGDLQKLGKLKVDYVFMPKSWDMYPKNFQTVVSVEKVSRGLCGSSRPGHFEGVATVVLKLLQITQSDFAIFGKKDFQQLKVIERLVSDLNIPVKIVAAPIVREEDGLALSSRNRYLSDDERKLALFLSRGLKRVQEACRGQKITAKRMRQIFLDQKPKNNKIKIDYVECLDSTTFKPLQKYLRGQTLVAVAAWVGKTRLIDNRVF